MSFIFRKVSRPWWYKDRRDEYDWLESDELVADILCDEMATKNGTLSTYILDSNKRNLNRIIAAQACTRDSIQNLDFVLIPETEIEQEYESCRSPGNTPDETVNMWHLDIIHLTPSKLTEFVYGIRDRRDMICRANWKKVECAILDGVSYGYIDVNKIKEPLRTKLSEKICQLPPHATNTQSASKK